MKRLLGLSLAALALAGCESLPFSPFVSPRVTGRVLAADTRQPLAGVTVRSGAHVGDFRGVMPPKGGELLIAKAPVRTDQDGWFVLQSQRALTPLRQSGWFSMQVLIEQAGYERFYTNYSLLNLGTNTWKGQFVLSAGDVLLHPARK